MSAHRSAGEPVLVSLPAIAFLALASEDDLIFLAGSDEGARARRYTWRADDGRVVDYWLGIDAITSVAGLCATLAEHPDAWLVVDEERIAATWAFGGPMAEVILGMTVGVYRAPGDALVRRVAPPDAQTVNAQQLCAARSP